MKALVINQDKQTRRMAFQSDQLQSLGIVFERVSAIELTGTEDPIYKKHFRTWLRPLSVTEVSCFLSHKKSWAFILSQNQPMLILEDDAWLDHKVSNVLNELGKMKGIDYATLEVTGSNRKKLVGKNPKENLCGVNLFRLYQGRSGAGGYALWPSGAKKLLDLAKGNSIGLADKFINSCYSLNAYQIEPALAIQLDQCAYHGITPPLEVTTTIRTKTEVKPNLKDYIQYKIRRVFGEVRIGINLLKHYPHSERRNIILSESFRARLLS